MFTLTRAVALCLLFVVASCGSAVTTPTTGILKSVNVSMRTGTVKRRTLLGVGVYRIIENGAVELHHDFHTFSTSLSTRIGPNSKVFRVAASGTRSSGTQTIKALAVSVVLL